jgi:hypothetical protein
MQYPRQKTVRTAENEKEAVSLRLAAGRACIEKMFHSGTVHE